MTKSQLQANQQKELHAKIWKMANDLRGSMAGIEFQNYILGMLFYRFLSDKMSFYVEDILVWDKITYEQAWPREDYREALKASALDELGFFIEPDNLFQSLADRVCDGTFDIEMLIGAIKSVIDSTRGQKSEHAFQGLFDDMDLHSTKLGKDVKSRSSLMGKVIAGIEEIQFTHLEAEVDILGEAYEMLIGLYAQSGGKLSGEFYSPPSILQICRKIATHDLDKVRTLYDPTCGSGGFLIDARKNCKIGKIMGQEKVASTAALARMNLILHGIDYDEFEIYTGDTLEDDYFEDEKFHVQLANPPYSIPYSASKKLQEDPRFSPYGVMAPKSKADWAFIQHMIHHMDDDGRIAVVLPHGALFRGSSEGVIRKFVIEQYNYLDAIIGLPGSLFVNTSIPTAILIFKKDRGKNKDNILFIDASKDFEAGKNQNRLREEDIDKIVKTYIERKDVDKYAKVTLIDEIRENDYNLNIPRYVDIFEEEERIDIAAVDAEIADVDFKILEVQKELEGYFRELGL